MVDLSGCHDLMPVNGHMLIDHNLSVRHRNNILLYLTLILPQIYCSGVAKARLNHTLERLNRWIMVWV